MHNKIDVTVGVQRAGGQPDRRQEDVMEVAPIGERELVSDATKYSNDRVTKAPADDLTDATDDLLSGSPLLRPRFKPGDEGYDFVVQSSEGKYRMEAKALDQKIIGMTMQFTLDVFAHATKHHSPLLFTIILCHAQIVRPWCQLEVCWV